jgi:hypothetical protein
MGRHKMMVQCLLITLLQGHILISSAITPVIFLPGMGANPLYANVQARSSLPSGKLCE